MSPGGLATTSTRPARAGAGAYELPPTGNWWRRLVTRPELRHYHRLAAAVLVGNGALLWYGLSAGWWPGPDSVAALGAAALANVALAVLVRQQYVINLFFWLATRAPTRWPLRIRWLLGKVYHFGGLHVGAALAGLCWYLAQLVVLTGGGAPGGGAAVVTGYLVAVLLLAIVGTALPPLRARRHDLFERTHRFGGWAVLVLLWIQAALLAGGVAALASTPPGWVLAGLTVSIALPWLRLRKVPIRVERPSAHVALVHFDHGVTPFPGSSTAISRGPLVEWHSFANVPAPGRPGFRLTISRAGDWTGRFIDEIPEQVWVKGISTAGVANIETLFRRVVYLATGSGIGPVLPHLLAGQVPARLVWVARRHRETFGAQLVAEILAHEPGTRLWDTALDGKPDMLRLAYEAYREFDAEAVICISNQALTWQVVHGLEQHGIPAFGAIWDS
ncbi:hypothetical protein [Micromonospora endophytica]|uniref:Uncharacterized protein n=1 Tax=Micromonospora endophytica TaxID=515350 RepID=A0A2W2D9M3_9ACTN|nr:hypothetical protein [Micromonospora endophytica]PZF93716.1 hypothetical protein C1I93_17545 [Micromonospora endophytica]RIW41764.1 hypothetical protein D3H59_24970 [Micromonospora endophytica]BCJ62965.1 hypothetical protein Jiend_63870 [Micromonospora endophytica]